MRRSNGAGTRLSGGCCSPTQACARPRQRSRGSLSARRQRCRLLPVPLRPLPRPLRRRRVRPQIGLHVRPHRQHLQLLQVALRARLPGLAERPLLPAARLLTAAKRPRWRRPLAAHSGPRRLARPRVWPHCLSLHLLPVAASTQHRVPAHHQPRPQARPFPAALRPRPVSARSSGGSGEDGTRCSPSTPASRRPGTPSRVQAVL